MSGLHECPRCGYRFETAEAVASHLEACEGCVNGQETGRSFLYHNDEGIIAMAWNGRSLADLAGDDDDIAIWTEWKDADGVLWYQSDHEGYTLDAEEFGPIPNTPA